MITIQTTIRNGLPVLAQGTVIVERETRWEPGGVRSGRGSGDPLAERTRLIRIEITAAEEARIIDELLSEADDHPR